MVVVSTGETVKIKVDNLWPDTLTGGMPVRVIGLEKKPKLNGKVGCLGEFDGSSARWLVKGLPDGVDVKLQPKNVVRVH